MAATFKDQLHTLKESGQRVGEGLREELRTAQAEIGRLQREADAQVLARAAAGTPDSGGRGLHLQEGRSSREVGGLVPFRGSGKGGAGAI